MKSLIMIILMILPLMMNLLILLIISIPSKKNKFNPMNFLLMLIMFTLILTLKMNFLMSSWSSYILFLVMIGGLLIIFMYITSLSNNELSYLNLKMIMMNILKKLPMIILIMMLLYYLIYIENNNIYIWNLNYMKILNNNFFEMFMYMYNFNNLFIMNYLFYSMICIMNICYKFKLPLRQLFF